MAQQQQEQEQQDEYNWLKFSKTWEHVVEDAETGRLRLQNAQSLQVAKRRHVPSVVRGIIRQLYLVVDLSAAMTDTSDILRPSLFECTMNQLKKWVREFFDANPISRVGIVAMRDGIAHRLLELSGNPADHIAVFSQLMDSAQYKGYASVENALLLTNTLLTATTMKTNASREVLLLMGSISSVDPGDVWVAVQKMQGVRVSCISLSAEIHMVKGVCKKLGGSYRVAADEYQLKDLLWEQIAPPPLTKHLPTSQILMGFPQRIPYPSLAADISNSHAAGYQCPRCKSKICSIPADCAVCNLKLISAPHLARSYHHLDPVEPFKDVSFGMLRNNYDGVRCFGCNIKVVDEQLAQKSDGVLRIKLRPGKEKTIQDDQDGMFRLVNLLFQCPHCCNHYCSRCESFVHDILHTCPGCCC